MSRWIVFPEYTKAWTVKNKKFIYISPSETRYVVARRTQMEGIVEPRCECISLQKANRISRALDRLERRYQ